MANPSEVITVRCAGPNCQEVKKEANHWWQLSSSPIYGFFCRPYKGEALQDHERAACGESCAQKLFARYLATGRLD